MVILIFAWVCGDVCRCEVSSSIPSGTQGTSDILFYYIFLIRSFAASCCFFPTRRIDSDRDVFSTEWGEEEWRGVKRQQGNGLHSEIYLHITWFFYFHPHICWPVFRSCAFLIIYPLSFQCWIHCDSIWQASIPERFPIALPPDLNHTMLLLRHSSRIYGQTKYRTGSMSVQMIRKNLCKICEHRKMFIVLSSDSSAEYVW